MTGASSGIGAATVGRLVKDGWDVLAVARRRDRLEALADEYGVHVHWLVADLTEPADVANLIERVDECDLLVNVAGGAFDADPVATGDPASWAWTFEVNVLATLRVIRGLLPTLRRARSASIITVTSTAGLVSYEGGGSYSAAKHAEHALVQTLRLELAGEPIRVMEIAPGMVQTDEFALNRFAGDDERARAVYADVDSPLGADDVAECIAWAAGLPPHLNIDQMVVRPLAQAAQHKVHRGALFNQAGAGR